jgi:hypothetical protein
MLPKCRTLSTDLLQYLLAALSTFLGLKAHLYLPAGDCLLCAQPGLLSDGLELVHRKVATAGVAVRMGQPKVVWAVFSAVLLGCYVIAAGGQGIVLSSRPHRHILAAEMALAAITFPKPSKLNHSCSSQQLPSEWYET